MSLEALRGGSAEVFSAAPVAVRCKLMIFVATVSLEALRRGSAEVFSAAPAAVRCKLMICSCYSEPGGAERG